MQQPTNESHDAANRDDRHARAALAQFERLADLDSAAQIAALDRLRGNDAELAAVVARLLQIDSGWTTQQPGHEQLLQRLVADEVIEAGRKLGPFVLLRLLGRGGMGEVWEARRDEAGFEQRVAIKCLYADLGAIDQHARFVLERQALGRLEHPAIARLIDAGVSDDGVSWLAMEHVDGVTITAHARAQRLSLTARAILLEAVCEAIAYAHQRLVLHRDIKPANVLVDAGGRVRVLDFGIARLLDVDDGALSLASARTPGYAAPEQERGEAVGTAADVYQLGLLLAELMLDVPLAQQTKAQRQRTLGADLASIIDTATAPAIGQRYAGANELACDLRRWREHRPLAAGATGPLRRIVLFLRRHRAASVLAALAVIAIVVGVVSSLRYADRAALALIEADQQASRARIEAATASGVSDVLSALFTGADPYASNRRDMTAREVLLDAAHQLAARRDLAVPVRQRLGNRLAGALDRVGELAAATTLLRETAAADGDPVERALSLGYLAELDRAEGRYDDARAKAAQALALAAAAGESGRGAMVQALTIQASTAAWDHQYEVAVGLLERALQQVLAMQPMPLSDRLQTEADLGHYLIFVERFDDAASHLQTAADLAGTNPATFRALAHHVELSRIYLLTRQRKYAEALAVADAQLPLSRAIYGADSSNEVQLRQLRSRALVGLGRHDDAVAGYRRVDAVLQKQNAPIPRRLENGWFIALTLLDGKQYAAALQASEALIALSDSTRDGESSRADFVYTAAEAELGLKRIQAARVRLQSWTSAEQVDRAARLPVPLLQQWLAKPGSP